MKNNKKTYYGLMLLSIILFIGAIFLLNDTKIISPILLVLLYC